MKRLVTLVTVLLVGLASVQAAQSDDQQKKKKKKQTQTAQATAAPTSSRTQTSKRNTGTQTSNQRVSSQTGKKHVNSQTRSNQQWTTGHSKKGNSNAGATTNYSTQTVNKSKKQTRKQINVTNNNVNKKAYRQFKRSGNEVTFNVARTQVAQTRHDHSWWRQHYRRIVFYGGGYWYWNAGWWYPAWGYNPYYTSYIYNGPIFGYGGVFPGDVTAEVQRALAALGYYYGPIDGILGSSTRAAIERYQINRGLAVTAAIDEPTLATLGLA